MRIVPGGGETERARKRTGFTTTHRYRLGVGLQVPRHHLLLARSGTTTSRSRSGREDLGEA